MRRSSLGTSLYPESYAMEHQSHSVWGIYKLLLFHSMANGSFDGLRFPSVSIVTVKLIEFYHTIYNHEFASSDILTSWQIFRRILSSWIYRYRCMSIQINFWHREIPRMAVKFVSHMWHLQYLPLWWRSAKRRSSPWENVVKVGLQSSEKLLDNLRDV